VTAIFISHSSADNAAAADMKKWLEAQGHTSLFLDFDPEAGIRGGAVWEQTLYQQLRQCQAVIALLTPSWLASKWCFAELVLARERGKAIFPVEVQPCEAGGVFRDIQHIDLTLQPEEGYRRLKIGLVERGLDPLDVFDWDPKRPPYPGLLAFQEADAAIFFGRGEDILKTLETLDGLRRQGRQAARFGLLLGASGGGKSSLLRAGVIPRLKKKPAEWLPVPPFRPQLEPLDELAMVLAAAFAGHGRPRDWSALRTELHAAAARTPVDGLALLNLARDLAMTSHQPETTVLLTIDQAEELFGYSPPEAATRFLRLLRAALEAADRRLMAVATLRSDFLGEFQNHPVLQDGDYAHHFRYQAMPVDPMPLRNFPAIIQGPARLAGLQLDDGLVEAMVHDTGTRDALPLLAFTLRRLYVRCGDDGRLTVGEYEALGRLEGAIREEVQRVIAEANPAPEELEALHAAFVPTMVRVSAEGGYARRRALFATMTQRAVPLLRRFVDARLLITDRDPQGQETIEVAHEALLRTWPQLGGWLAEDRDKLRLLESIQRAAEEWDQGGRRDDLLIHRNGRLKDAEALLANPRFTMPEASAERAYLVACSAAQQAREAAEKEEQGRRIRDAERIAEEQKKAAEAQKVATSRQLAAHAVHVLDERLDHALLLAAAAWKTAATLEAEAAMLAALQKSPHLDHYRSCPYLEYYGSVAISPDGQLTATSDPDGRVEIRSAADPGKLKLMLNTPKKTANVLFSVDARHVVTCFYDTGFAVWDAESGALVADERTKEGRCHEMDKEGRLAISTREGVRLWSLHERRVIAGPMPTPLGDVHFTGYTSSGERVGGWGKEPVQPDATAFSPNGDLVAVGYHDGSIVLWNTRTGQPAGSPLRGHTSLVTALAFSGDGRVLASGSHDNSIRFWNVSTREPIGKPLQKHEQAIKALAFSRDGKNLASGAGDGNIYLWMLREGYQQAYAKEPLTGHHSSVDALVWERSDEALISAAANGSAIRWNRSFGHWPVLPGYANGLSVSKDGRYIAAGSYDGVVTVWDVQSREKRRSLYSQAGEVTSLAFSPDAKRLVVTGRQAVVELWDVVTGDCLAREFKAHGVEGGEATYSPGGLTILSSGKDSVIRIWSATDLYPIAELKDAHQSEVLHLASSPKAQVLASSGRYGSVQLWDLQSRTKMGKEINAVGDVTELCFSPDGSRLFTAGDRGKIEVWDVATQDRAHGPLDGKAFIGSIAVSPSGKLLATGNGDGSITIWDIETLAPRQQRLKVQDSIIQTVKFDPQERYIAASGHGGVALVDLRPDNWVKDICRKVRRNLSKEEWRLLEPTQPIVSTCHEYR
jgi:WD40 repeat protein